MKDSGRDIDFTETSPDDRHRAARSWLETWRVTGALLHEVRLKALACMGEDEARQATLDLFAMWRPAAVDPEGSELVEQQRVFKRAAPAWPR